MQEIGLAILYLTALAAYLSLGWVIWCAGRRLYRWLHPWNEAVDARAREYLTKPCKLWPPGLGLETQRTADSPGKRLTTAKATRIASSDAQEADSTTAPIPVLPPSGRRTMPTYHAAPPSVSVDVPDAWKRGGKTDALDA